MNKKIIFILKGIGLFFILFIALFPLFWMFITSGKTMTELLKIPVTLWPESFSFESYYEVWVQKSFPTYIFNSLKISIAATLLGMAVSSMAAYGVAKFRFPLNKGLLMFVLVAQMFPSTSILIPLFSTYSNYGLYDTPICLLLLF